MDASNTIGVLATGAGDVFGNRINVASGGSIWGLNDVSTDRMALRRGGAWEEDEALFATKMDWYQLVNG